VASTLATFLLAFPARFQDSSCQVGPLIVVVPSFLLIPAGLLDTVGTKPPAAAVVLSLQHGCPYRIRAVYGAARRAHTPHTRTHMCSYPYK
jgi:hypothetical protein